jgi:hypothetical protein
MDRRVKPGDDGGERDQIDRKMRHAQFASTPPASFAAR